MLGRSENPMTPELLICLLLVAVASVFAIRFMVERSGSGRSVNLTGKEIDLERYAVMHNLLNPRDTAYLSECGLSQMEIAQFRRNRRRIFRTYLSNLERDAGRVFQSAESYVRDVAAEAPELSARLAEARLRFRLAVWTLRWRLVLHALGAEGVDVSEVLSSASEFAASLRTPARTAAVV